MQKREKDRVHENKYHHPSHGNVDPKSINRTKGGISEAIPYMSVYSFIFFQKKKNKDQITTILLHVDTS
jgi:hypothetical protein